MKYNWNIQEIRNNIITLNNMLKFEKEEEKREKHFLIVII